MRKQLLLLFAVCIAVSSFGQISIPNGNFESWTTTSFDSPTYYPCTSISSNRPEITITKSTDSYSGSFAVNLKSIVASKDTVSGYLININPNGPPSKWTGGMAISGMPKSIRGYYKYNIADSASIILAFSKAGVNIGTLSFNLGGIKNSYTLFDFQIPSLGQTPDSVAVAYLATKFINGGELKKVVGAEFIIDSVSFTGLPSQPSMMNGDFETWKTTTNHTINTWYYNGDEGVSRTTDSNSGNYAVELTSYSRDSKGNQICEPSRLHNYTYPQNCNGNCSPIGGLAFNNQIDTLAFYYKYTPANPNDIARVSLSFKKNGNYIDNKVLSLSASSTFKLAQLPFALVQKPDTIHIIFETNDWKDTLLSYVGAKLIIDDVHFKTKPSIPTELGTADSNIQITPNPCNGKFHIKGINDDNSMVELYNLQGIKVFSNPVFDKIKDDEIDISSAGKGVYLLKITSDKKTSIQKIVVE
jgi:hypothetical protein